MAVVFAVVPVRGLLAVPAREGGIEVAWSEKAAGDALFAARGYVEADEAACEGAVHLDFGCWDMSGRQAHHQHP